VEWLVEVMVYAVAKPVLRAVLALFGYDFNWEPTDGQKKEGWRLVIAALFCCAVSGIVLGGLIWIVWFAGAFAL
jgi:hypothetical protein